MIDIFNPQEEAPTDAEILSFWRMVFAPEMMVWEYEDDSAFGAKTDEQALAFARTEMLPNPRTIACWARTEGRVVGMASLSRATEPYRSHIAEIGYCASPDFRRRGVGTSLVRDVINRGRDAGLRRIECSCLADNVASIALLRRAGFAEEGLQRAAVLKDGVLRDIRLFGLLL